MSSGSFRDLCYAALDRLFRVVSSSKGEVAVQQCLRHLIALPNVTAHGTTFRKLDFYLLPECLHNPTNLSTYVTYLETRDAVRVPYNITMLKLYGYVQCIEVRYIYKVVGNLLGHIGGGSTKGNLYDSFLSAHRCFEDIKKRHDRVKRVLGTSDLVNLWSSFLDFNLRNAVAHSDFIIRSESQGVLIPLYVLEEVRSPHGSRRQQSTYSFSELDTLYSRANDYNEAFKEVIQVYGADLGPRY